jgi:hypothetical protein
MEEGTARRRKSDVNIKYERRFRHVRGRVYAQTGDEVPPHLLGEPAYLCWTAAPVRVPLHYARTYFSQYLVLEGAVVGSPNSGGRDIAARCGIAARGGIAPWGGDRTFDSDPHLH